MTMDDLFKRVEDAIARYEQACQQEEMLYEMISDAERDYSRYSSQMASAEDPNAQSYAAQQVAAAQRQYAQCQSQLQQVQSMKAHALRELQAIRSGVTDAMESLTQKLVQIRQSIGTFEQMASLPFGGAAASEKLITLRERSQEYQRNLNDLGALADKIDSAVEGGGNSPQKVLRR